MKNARIAVLLLLLLSVPFLQSCYGDTQEALIEMEISQNYNMADPYINRR